MTTFATDVQPTDLKSDMGRLFQKKRLLSFGLPVLLLAYLAYVFVSFDIAGLRDRINVKNAHTLISDSYSYKTHVTRDNRDASVSVAIEGERKGTYSEGQSPAWVSLGETTVINLEDGHIVRFGPEKIEYDIPGYGVVSALPDRSGVNALLPEGDVPDWISVSKNRLAITTDAGRLTVTRNRTEVFRYFGGWELFFFTLDSPYHGLSIGQLLPPCVAGRSRGDLSRLLDQQDVAASGCSLGHS